MRKQHKAFTLVEMMVAIFIVVLLVSMVTIAVQKVVISSKANATKGMLQTGFTLLEEWRRGANNYPTFPWPIVSPTTGLNTFLPGDIKTGGAGLDSEAFQLSRAAMRRMAERSSVQTLIGKIPDARFTAPTVVFSGLPTTVTTPGIGYAFKGTFSARTGTGDRFFICFNAPVATAKLAAPTDSNPENWPANYTDYWMESSGGGTHILKDAWDNPMLLVPSCGFQATDLTNNPILVTSDGVKTQFCAAGATFLDRLVWDRSKSYLTGQIVIAPLAKAPAQWGLFLCATNHTSSFGNQPDTSGGKQIWDRVPGVPFFASAGPDGIFFDPNNPKTLQDNIYSFEN